MSKPKRKKKLEKADKNLLDLAVKVLVVVANGYYTPSPDILIDPTSADIENAKKSAVSKGFDAVWCHYSNVIDLDAYRIKKAG